MLIKCPECGKEVSDKLKQCIHCGYPLRSNYTSVVNGKEYDLSFIFDDDYSYLYKVRDFVQITKCDIPTARQYIDKFINEKSLPPSFQVKAKVQQTDSHPKCPTCGSVNIRKISATSKVVGAIGFGLFSKTAKSQFECLDCKYKW